MKRILFVLTFLILIFTASEAFAASVVFNFGLNFRTQSGSFVFDRIPFFNGDHTGFRLDTTDVDTSNDRIDFDIVGNTPGDTHFDGFIIESAEIFVDARGIARNSDERGVLRITAPGFRLGRLNDRNGNAEVPLIGGGRAFTDPILGPDTDSRDNSFFFLPSDRDDYTGGTISFRIIARDDTRFRVDGVNLQVIGRYASTTVPEPGTLILLGLGFLGTFLRRLFQ